MISDINPMYVEKILRRLKDDMNYVSLLEESPGGYMIKSEVRSQAYRRCPVEWVMKGPMLVNRKRLVWRNLEPPFTIRAYGLHARGGDNVLLGWGLTTRDAVVEPMNRGNLSKHILDEGELSIRIV